MKNQFKRHLEAIKDINRYQFFGWFLALALPWALAMSAFIGWHNSVVGQVQPRHLVLRMAIGIAGLLPIIVVLFCKFFLPAVRKAEQVAEGKPNIR
ncbi:MAG: hypothetical protein WD872_18550 [Pirellulaceae bacterium]